MTKYYSHSKIFVKKNEGKKERRKRERKEGKEGGTEGGRKKGIEGGREERRKEGWFIFENSAIERRFARRQKTGKKKKKATKNVWALQNTLVGLRK
jgi:hypothetical protein